MHQFSLDRCYFPNFDVAIAELLAVFGSNMVLLTVAVFVTFRKRLRPLFSGPQLTTVNLGMLLQRCY